MQRLPSSAFESGKSATCFIAVIDHGRAISAFILHTPEPRAVSRTTCLDCAPRKSMTLVWFRGGVSANQGVVVHRPPCADQSQACLAGNASNAVQSSLSAIRYAPELKVDHRY